MAHQSIDELDASGTLAALESGVVRRRAAELEDLVLVAHWAVLQSTDPRDDPRPVPGLPRPPGGDRLDRVGGEGTPKVRELSLCELGIARGVHTLAARAVTADVLDLQHRLPDTWARVVALECDAWLARKVASLSRHLPVALVGVVDTAVSAAIAGEAPSRVLAIAEAKVIEADPAGHAERVRRERHRRHVSLTRVDEVGLRTVIARVTAGDAAWVDAMIARVTEILFARPEHAEESTDVLRSMAFGWLARPTDLMTLLLESADVPAAVGEASDVSVVEEPDALCRLLALPADLLEALRSLDPARFRPDVKLYVHLHEAALAGTVTGVARVEGLGPMLLGQVRDLLGHAHVTCAPVIDVAEMVSVDAYEHPEALAERVRLLRPVDAFPHAAGVSRNTDLDHPTPYRAQGPPGQTSSHRSQPLGRTAHRAKTHLGYTCTPLPTGETVWQTPHGRHRLVDARGTHHLTADDYDGLTNGDPVDRALTRLLIKARTGLL